MDYSSIINLALITIIYSTFVAPGLSKLDSIRDSIAEIQFPEYTKEGEANHYVKKLQKQGEVLQGKLNAYRLKYRALKKFLNYFHIIILVLLFVQIGQNWYAYLNEDNVTISAFVALLIVAVIVGILNLAIDSFMLDYHEVSSVAWLTKSAGMNPYIYRQLAGAKLEALAKLTDPSNARYTAEFNLLLEKFFIGYRYVLTVENKDHSKLYYVSSGPIYKETDITRWLYATNRTIFSAALGSVNLKPGAYRVRILLLESPFGKAHESPHETVMDFVVQENSKEQKSEENIEFVHVDGQYITFRAEGLKLKKIICNEKSRQEEGIVRLLNTKRFVRLLKTCRRAFEFDDKNGHLDPQRLGKILSRRRVLGARLLRWISRKNIVKLT